MDTFYIDPRNWQAWQIFKELDTQWNVGMGGAIGINGGVFMQYLECRYKSPSKRIKIFKKILLISKGALSAMSDKKRKNKEK